MNDFASRRTMMVDTQVRPNDVTKYPIIAAMLDVAREEFVPDAAREAAYMGENIHLGPTSVVLEPRTFAKLLDALDVQASDHVLDLGAGLGYSAAVLGRVAARVTALEADAGLADRASRTLAGVGNVALRAGVLAEGAPGDGPFDRIILEGAIEHFPQALAAQLKEGGRVAAIFMEGALGMARIGHKIDGEISWRFAFNATAPVLAGFERARSFRL